MVAEAEKAKYESGLTWKTIVTIIYTAVILQPAVIWIYLSTGSMILSMATYASIFVFGELFNLIGKPLKKQEIAVFLIGGGIAASGANFGPALVYSLYYRRHPLTAAYGLREILPTWWAPPYNTPIWDLRTFFHPDWILPISVSIIGAVIAPLINVSLGFLTRELYVVREKLPFPMQQVTAQMCTTLAERDTSKLRVLSVCAVTGMAYSIIQYGIPSLTDAIFNMPVLTIPLPWIDLNYIIERILPGASLGVGTDISMVAIGLILPSTVIISIFIGSMAIMVFGNAVLVSLNMFTEWTPGMSLHNIWTRSLLNFWTGPNIAMAVAAGLMPMILRPKPIIETFKGLFKPVRKEGGLSSVRNFFLIFFVGAAASVALYHILVPEIPIWIPLILTFGWGFILNIASARILGFTGIEVNIPYVYQGILLTSGYTGVNAWLAPLPGIGLGGAGWCANFKVAELTSTNPLDFVKALAIALPLALISGLVFTQMFWTLAPIPSRLFPAPFWDAEIIFSLLFLSRKVTYFRPDWMIGAFVIGALIQVLAFFAHIPVSLPGIAAGITTPIASSISLLIGYIIGKILQRFFGKEWFMKTRTMIIAGILIGEGFAIAFSAALAITFKAQWIEPY